MTSLIDEVAPILEPVVLPTKQPESDAPPEEKQIILSQSALDNLIKSRQAASLKKAAALEKENQRLKEIAAGSQPDSTELEKVRAELSAKTMETERLREDSITAQKTSLIVQQAQKQGFVDADVIVKLTRDNLKWDDATKGFVVVDDSGNPKTNAAGELVSPESFFQEYASARPYMVRGTTITGTGSTGSTGSAPPPQVPLEYYFGPKSNSAAVNKLSLTRPDEYARLRREAVKKGLI